MNEKSTLVEWRIYTWNEYDTRGNYNTRPVSRAGPRELEEASCSTRVMVLGVWCRDVRFALRFSTGSWGREFRGISPALPGSGLATAPAVALSRSPVALMNKYAKNVLVGVKSGPKVIMPSATEVMLCEKATIRMRSSAMDRRTKRTLSCLSQQDMKQTNSGTARDHTANKLHSEISDYSGLGGFGFNIRPAEYGPSSRITGDLHEGEA